MLNVPVEKPNLTTLTAFTPQQEADALLAPDALRAAALADRHGIVFPDVASELESLRELRLLELQGES